MNGLEVCRHHGGSAPQTRAAGARNVAVAEVMDRIDRLDLSTVGRLEYPVDELSRALAQQVALKDFLADRLAVTSESSPAYAEIAEVTVLALDRVTRRLTDAAKVGLDADRAALTERHVAGFMQSMDRALEAAGVDRETERTFRRTMRDELVKLAHGGAIEMPNTPAKREVTDVEPL